MPPTLSLDVYLDAFEHFSVWRYMDLIMTGWVEIISLTFRAYIVQPHDENFTLLIDECYQNCLTHLYFVLLVENSRVFKFIQINDMFCLY